MKYFLTFIAAFVILSCNSSGDETEVTTTEEVVTDSTSEFAAEQSFYNPAEALWTYEYDTVSHDFYPAKKKAFDPDTLNIEKVQRIVNATWPGVQIQVARQSHDTIYISIPDSKVLTQQLGTSGANEFIASTTYSFTELKGIQYVAYDFEAGDHAEPGVFSRRMWKK